MLIGEIAFEQPPRSCISVTALLSIIGTEATDFCWRVTEHYSSENLLPDEIIALWEHFCESHNNVIDWTELIAIFALNRISTEVCDVHPPLFSRGTSLLTLKQTYRLSHN